MLGWMGCCAIGATLTQVDTISVAGFAQTVLPQGAVFVLTAAQIAGRVQIIQSIDSLMSVLNLVREAQPEVRSCDGLLPCTQRTAAHVKATP